MVEPASGRGQPAAVQAGRAGRDEERVDRIVAGLEEAGLDALVCALPTNVLLLTGYWPVLGTALAVATRDGAIGLIVPEDELALVTETNADLIEAVRFGSLDRLSRPRDAIRRPLAHMLSGLGLERSRFGLELGSAFQPVPYVGIHLYGGKLRQLLHNLCPEAELKPGDALLARLRSLPSARELQHIRRACLVAAQAFADGAVRLRPGLSEREAASIFRHGLSTHTPERACRSDGHVFCMSGRNGADAANAFARSSGRRIRHGDLVLVHCNSHVDGYWTDITRTYLLGSSNGFHRTLYAAVFQARQSALDAIRPGVRASEVDRAARSILGKYGLGASFKHSAGHGVGFAAIDHRALPRLHPRSQDVLEVGMVFNVEPGVYLPELGGLRHCDVVTVTYDGSEVLTPFQLTAEELVKA